MEDPIKEVDCRGQGEDEVPKPQHEEDLFMQDVQWKNAKAIKVDLGTGRSETEHATPKNGS